MNDPESVEEFEMLQAALPPILIFMELDTAKYVGESLDTNLCLLMHLEHIHLMIGIAVALMGTMLMVSVSLTEGTLESTSGHLLED